MDKVKKLYKLANGNQISVEVTTEVNELLEKSDHQIRTQGRQDRRHLSFIADTDKIILQHLCDIQEDMTDLLERKYIYSYLHKAIGKLSDKEKIIYVLL